jgi:hypothetical protein
MLCLGEWYCAGGRRAKLSASDVGEYQYGGDAEGQMATSTQQHIAHVLFHTFHTTPHPVRDAVQALLRQHPDGLTWQEIEAMLGRTNMRRAVSTLAEAGYITNRNKRGMPARYIVDALDTTA